SSDWVGAGRAAYLASTMCRPHAARRGTRSGRRRLPAAATSTPAATTAAARPRNQRRAAGPPSSTASTPKPASMASPNDVTSRSRAERDRERREDDEDSSPGDDLAPAEPVVQAEAEEHVDRGLDVAAGELDADQRREQRDGTQPPRAVLGVQQLLARQHQRRQPDRRVGVRVAEPDDQV